ncbi:hypothetical protein [Streptomyces sp. NPDC001068]|uniref:hypothetical protein n=1 Tax=Streptomyces sp. NPDC001068 TaxID=3364544 RepID=UPI0036AB1C6D
MPTPVPCCGHACMSADAVNEAIRRLMSQPADQTRAEEYQRLLELWAPACRRAHGNWTTTAA